ncbi:MAG: nitrate reductase cytochrome c-type subunit [Xanthobacteraceae bacterium]|nr:MAG: nitrate reductase cytochrome c-type subunit [Xanthobacteraceae bacterium]
MTDFRRFGGTLAAATLAALFTIGLATVAGHAQQASPLKSLRGEVGIEDINPAPAVTKQEMPADGMFNRSYRQQPPLIPHRIDGYQITKDYNQCMTCHDWPANTKAGAPKVSETHYNDREGNRLDKITGTRFFCTQCHVPQADARPLISNTFQDATQVK